MAAKNSIVFTDMEGTLFTKSPIEVRGKISPSVWGMIPALLGPEAQEVADEGCRKWNENEFAGYVEWVDYAANNYRTHGLMRPQFEEILRSLDYHPGVRETFALLRDKYRTALISGGFKAQAEKAQRDLKLDHSLAACDLYWDDEGRLEHWNSMPCDYEGKVDFMKLIIKEHKADPATCVFIGDGVNDVPLAKAVGISIAFNGHPELQRVSTHSVNQAKGEEDFRAVLDFIPR